MLGSITRMGGSVSLRPAEKILLGFFIYCFLRILWNGSVSWEGTRWAAFPGASLTTACLFVVLLRLIRSHPWSKPRPDGRESRGYRLLLSAGFILGMTVMLAYGPEGWSGIDGWLHAFRHGFLVILLGALGWLVLSSFKIRRPAGDRGAFLRESVYAAVLECRNLGPWVAILCFYPWVPLILQRSGVADRDSALLAIDRWIFWGHDPVRALQWIVTPWLSDWLAFCYSAYGYIFLLVMAVVYAKPERDPFFRVSSALILTLALGYIGYTVVPAIGPLYTQNFDVEIRLRYLAAFKTGLMDQTRIERDCFPSLHTAVSGVMLWAAYRHARRLFWPLLPIVLSIPFACVYLRYHYVTDVLAGLILSGCVVCWAERSRV